MNILEQVHGAGYVFNDLKLDNLMLDFDADVDYMVNSEDDIFDTHNVNLIDFGFATSYLRADSNEHISKKKADTFRGSMVFSSLH